MQVIDYSWTGFPFEAGKEALRAAEREVAARLALWSGDGLLPGLNEEALNEVRLMARGLAHLVLIIPEPEVTLQLHVGELNGRAALRVSATAPAHAFSGSHQPWGDSLYWTIRDKVSAFVMLFDAYDSGVRCPSERAGTELSVFFRLGAEE